MSIYKRKVGGRQRKITLQHNLHGKKQVSARSHSKEYFERG